MQELVEKHGVDANTSLSRDSNEMRARAWDNIVEEFNSAKLTDVYRDLLELKIKNKNMKAQRHNTKTENSSRNVIEIEEHSFIEPDPLTRSSGVTHSTPAVRILRAVKIPAKNSYEILDELDPTWDQSDDDVS